GQGNCPENMTRFKGRPSSSYGYFGGWGGSAPLPLAAAFFCALGDRLAGFSMRARVTLGSLLSGTIPGLPPPPRSQPARGSKPAAATTMPESQFRFKLSVLPSISPAPPMSCDEQHHRRCGGGTTKPRASLDHVSGLPLGKPTPAGDLGNENPNHRLQHRS